MLCVHFLRKKRVFKTNMEENQDTKEKQIQWIKPPALFKANIWKYFKLSTDKNYTMCNICQQVLKYSGNSTTGMRRHVNSQHPGEQIDKTTGSKAALLNTEGSSKPSTPKAQESNISDKFFNIVKKGSAKDASITASVLEYIVKDIQ